jgi:general stress protein 14
MKTLVILAHPNMQNSRINKKLKEELEKYPDEFEVHELYKKYPDWNIDIEKEQKLMEKYGRIILEFPIYSFSCPPLLKKWFDDVWTFGWAYGVPEGGKLKNKEIGVAVSAGGLETEYTTISLSEILSPFRACTLYVEAKPLPHFAVFGAVQDMSDEKMSESAKKYIEYIRNPR